ncbi:SLBB domain-containing protein [Glacieibacterium sp.]|uniref:SLBB domain-containing protein n=1 Tax=Glacieibacterium sp. TaxID=2860237 RepID=UPI003AFFE228
MRVFVTLWRLLVAIMILGSATAAMAQTGGGYILGPDDTVQIQVYGQTDASITTRIKSDGTIVMPLIGSIKATGQTTLSLADLITKKLVSGGFFKAPVVNVEVGGFASRTVNVAGKVGAPGIYPLDRAYRVLEVLLKAGWVRENGANYIYLRRGSDYKETRLDTEALVRGTADKDPLLEPNDTLYVPDADTFYVTGAINKPGALPLLRGMTVRQAIALAGGVTAAGSDKKVGLYRVGSKEKDEIDLDQQIQKNDVLVIKERLF